MANTIPKATNDYTVSLQDIQDFINHTLRIKSDVSAPIIISLLIFIIGCLINGLIKKWIGYNQRANIRKMFILNLKILIIDLTKQCQNFKDLAKQLIFKDTNNFILKDTHLFQVILIHEIGYKESYNAFFAGFENTIFKSFFRSKRIEAFNSIWESIEFVRKWQDKPKNDSDDFTKHYNDNNQKRNKALGEYFKIIEPFLMDAPHNQDLSEALKCYAIEIDNIHLNWQKTSNRTNVFTVHRKLVLPVRLLNRRFENVQLIYQTYHPLLEASYAYSEMSSALSVYRGIFNDYSISFGNRAININKAIKII